MPNDSVFVGRTHELRQFDQVLRSPKGQAILVIGEQGMGRTVLSNEMAMSAAAGHPDLTCQYVRFEVTQTDSPEQIMELVIDRAFHAAGVKGRRLDPAAGEYPHGSENFAACTARFCPT